VRAHRRLDDTVQQYGRIYWARAPASNSGSPARGELLRGAGWAVSTYYDRLLTCSVWSSRPWRQDFSWGRSAEEYLKVYERAIANKQI